MDIKVLAAALLIGRLVSVYFMVMVIAKQLKLFKLRASTEVSALRRTLFTLAVAILLGNVVPIILDVATIVEQNSFDRGTDPSTIGVVYAFSNCITSAISAIFIWKMYRQAARTAIITEHDKQVALDKK